MGDIHTSKRVADALRYADEKLVLEPLSNDTALIVSFEKGWGQVHTVDRWAWDRIDRYYSAYTRLYALLLNLPKVNRKNAVKGL